METGLTTQRLERLIFEFRGEKVMVDADLAALYGTETKKLKQQVKRNKDRFPKDFMFELTGEEKDMLIGSGQRLEKLKHASIKPAVFTEQGVAMLSSVLKTKRAVQMNIEIMRAFARYRSLLMETAGLRKEMKALDAKLDGAFKFLLDRIDALSHKEASRKPLGFRRRDGS